MIDLGKSACTAAHSLALTPDAVKNKALIAMAAALRNAQTDILKANEHDVQMAQKKNKPAAFLDRLTLTAHRIETMAQSLENIAQLPDPVGRTLAVIKRPNGLEITRISVPLGVIGIIYEARPNVTADAAGLCIKSGNAVILRGGSDSFHTSTAIVAALHQGLAEAHVPLTAVQMVPTTDRAALDELLKMSQYIDVIIPRGGPELIDYIHRETRIPLLEHLAGLCHTYIHSAANKSMAKKVLLNAKMRRTGICGATEVLLIDQSIIASYLPEILDALIQAGCEIRGDAMAVALDSRIKKAGEKDFDTEFLAPILAVKTVTDISEAIAHITQHGSNHTDAIITEDSSAAQKFLNEVNSAIVLHNASTQFADGGEFGMGAEIGIATGKLHARGPVGIEQLTTFKYLVRGTGQTRD